MNTSSSTDTDRRLALQLHRISSLFQSRRFQLFFLSEDCRFPGDWSALFARLRNDLLFQVRQSVSTDFANTLRAEGRIWLQCPAAELFPQMGREIGALAEKIAPASTFRKADLVFKVSHNTNPLEAVYALANSGTANDLCVRLHALEKGAAGGANFGARNALSSLGLFVESLNTLAHPTPYPAIENILAAVTQRGVEYFAEGYPHDILAHDVRSFRDGRKVVEIFVRKSYAASVARFANGPEIVHDGGVERFAA
jgi:hypothetical protein